MSLAVDNPILNNLFEKPKEYWIYDEGQPKRMSGRRPDTQIEKLPKPESVYF